MNRMRVWLMIVLSVLAIGALAVACGGNSSGDDDDDDDDTGDDDDDDGGDPKTDCETICAAVEECELGAAAACASECENLTDDTAECLLTGATGANSCDQFSYYFSVCNDLDNVGTEEGERMANFTLLDYNGEEVSLYDYVGHVVLISLGAGWCPPCREEAPTLQEMYEEFGDQNFTVLSVLFEDNSGGVPDAEFLGGWANRYGLEFPVIGDPNLDWGIDYVIIGSDNTIAIPQNFVLDRSMNITDKIEGFAEIYIRNKVEDLL